VFCLIVKTVNLQASCRIFPRFSLFSSAYTVFRFLIHVITIGLLSDYPKQYRIHIQDMYIQIIKDNNKQEKSELRMMFIFNYEQSVMTRYTFMQLCWCELTTVNL